MDKAFVGNHNLDGFKIKRTCVSSVKSKFSIFWRDFNLSELGTYSTDKNNLAPFS